MIDVETFECKSPEILLDLAKHIETELVSGFKASEEDAKNFAIKMAQTIAKNWGGEVIYIPRNIGLLLSERDKKIYDEFNGTNHRELARKYNVSMQWVYAIVKRVGKEEIAKRQPDMFGTH
ncbi:transcriptional regulator [Actinobacillus equuli subsp. haemolyticus]|uniref:Mor transcription activator family protein n=1 Tax=Actinobacillus equuli TaxID=718 RepID=UPI0024182C61|nr:Mor transcription activator family protein [Actinobacillus equuli]MDG4949149.1 transcriptional regulator [Actinobacillus equuli subsp. haemolyticus]MDG4949160.1 transcriptional regulator [Actinobacillus equuli subsp. haemolyticus]MDG4949281.1 transcriptional regulator [Actinobacillus equuli subsp. haemolyticus]